MSPRNRNRSNPDEEFCAGESAGFILVAAVDSPLRTEAFQRLAALGCRVDAVGDLQAAERRLLKDQYDLILTDELNLESLTREVKVIEINTELLEAGDSFEKTIGRELE